MDAVVSDRRSPLSEAAAFFILKESSPFRGLLNKTCPLEVGMLKQTVVKRG